MFECFSLCVCVCVKSAAINCVCLLCRWRDSPLPCCAAPLLLCCTAALRVCGMFATCAPSFTPHTHTPATGSHLATSAQCECVLCARVRFHLSAISNAASHPAQERGTARWEIRLCSAPRYAPPDSVSDCHGDWPRRQLQRQKEKERERVGWVSEWQWTITLVNGSLIAAAAAQLATRLKCKLKTCSQLAQDDSLPVFSGSLVLSPFCSPTCSLHLHNATNSSKSNNYHTHTHKVRHTHLHLQLSEVFVKPKGRIKSSSDAMQRTTNI